MERVVKYEFTDRITLANGRMIGHGQPCFIVAEIGQNHNGDAYTATRLLKAAHDAGVDAVKFTKRHLSSDMTQAMWRQP
jgi:sialic acid synthase SpsE